MKAPPQIYEEWDVSGGTQEPWGFRAIGFLILLGALIWFCWKCKELVEGLPV